jgi:hypothetical protein
MSGSDHPGNLSENGKIHGKMGCRKPGFQDGGQTFGIGRVVGKIRRRHINGQDPVLRV